MSQSSNLEPPGLRFYDRATCRDMILVTEGAWRGWLCYRHPDGQWVSLRIATPDDMKRIEDANPKKKVTNMLQRELTSHKVNGVNGDLTILAMDEPGPGGANHHYRLIWGGFPENPNAEVANYVDLNFQNGPIAEVGTNGVTHEALLAIVADRLQGFQRGQFACRENAIALTKLQEAQMWLKSRTEARLARGVEGTMTV